ncbi:gamma-glutamyltransferase [Mycolicibacterium sp. YH-1]|uniref:gamma-glutamyltransferase n=1 Tax=Mycolicibacterium sp. YH-1 TaxID=2908837 RepID=UPI001F4BD815|nr:gamma-glutamyltransferase [Mycolicibacterium sp. YH-1]UNB52197.1 gamma-glutamyltransferase family protein [Mycolicibacterium sp. YH-1]
MTTPRPGAVASGHPLATKAGLDALAAGGSAVDAALSAAFTQWTVNSPMCGPGGEMLLMVVNGEHVTVYGGWSRTPSRLPALDPIPYSGPEVAVVPGAIPAAYAAWKDYGVLSWSRLFTGGIEAADNGHKVTDQMAASYASVARKHPSTLGDFFDQQTVPVVGDTVTSERFARTLALLAVEGPSALRSGGRLAKEIVNASKDAGGYLTMADLTTAAPQVCEAPTVELDGGLRLSFPGAPSQAPMIAELLEATDPQYAAESAEFVTDVAPTTEAALIRRCVAGLNGTATAIAATGKCAAVAVHSLAGVQYGTGWIAGNTGIALGNRVGTAHSTRPELPGAHLRPGQHPAHTLSAVWLRHGSRSALIATPGGDRQVQWLAQCAQRFRQGHDIEDLVTEPRWFVCPEGDRFGVPGGVGAQWFLFAEPGVPWRDRRELAGYAIKSVDSIGGGLQAVQPRLSEQWSSASDPRAGGSAATWCPSNGIRTAPTPAVTGPGVHDA